MAVVAGDGSEQKRLVLVRGTALSPAWTQQHPIPGPIHWLVLASFAGACGEAEGGPRQQYLRWCVVAPVAGWGLLLINPDDEDALSRGGPARAQTEVEPRPRRSDSRRPVLGLSIVCATPEGGWLQCLFRHVDDGCSTFCRWGCAKDFSSFRHDCTPSPGVRESCGTASLPEGRGQILFRRREVVRWKVGECS